MLTLVSSRPAPIMQAKFGITNENRSPANNGIQQSKRSANKTQMTNAFRRLPAHSPIAEQQQPNSSSVLHSRNHCRMGVPLVNNHHSQFASSFNEFEECAKCEFYRSSSLDSWMDHLGSTHPVPTNWLSARASSLTGADRNHPYTAVVDSHKKRKAETVPRPLNSFMIFAQYIRRLVLHVFPEAPNVHISQRIGHLWRSMNSDLRGEYSSEAQRLQELHAMEFPDYKYRPRKRLRTPSLVQANNYYESLASAVRTDEDAFSRFPSGALVSFAPHAKMNTHKSPYSDESGEEIDSVVVNSPILKSRQHLPKSPMKLMRLPIDLVDGTSNNNNKRSSSLLSNCNSNNLNNRSQSTSVTHHQPVILRKNKPVARPPRQQHLSSALTDSPITALITGKNRKQIGLKEPLIVLTSGTNNTGINFLGTPSQSPLNGVMLYNAQPSHNSNVFTSLTPTGSSSISPSSCFQGPNSDVSRGELAYGENFWHQHAPLGLDVDNNNNGSSNKNRTSSPSVRTVKVTVKQESDEPPSIYTRIAASMGLKIDSDSAKFKMDCMDECANMQAPSHRVSDIFSDIMATDGFASLDDLNTLSLFQPSDNDSILFKTCLDENNNSILLKQDEDTIPCVIR